LGRILKKRKENGLLTAGEGTHGEKEKVLGEKSASRVESAGVVGENLSSGVHQSVFYQREIVRLLRRLTH